MIRLDPGQQVFIGDNKVITNMGDIELYIDVEVFYTVTAVAQTAEISILELE